MSSFLSRHSTRPADRRSRILLPTRRPPRLRAIRQHRRARRRSSSPTAPGTPVVNPAPPTSQGGSTAAPLPSSSSPGAGVSPDASLCAANRIDGGRPGAGRWERGRGPVRRSGPQRRIGREPWRPGDTSAHEAASSTTVRPSRRRFPPRRERGRDEPRSSRGGTEPRGLVVRRRRTGDAARSLRPPSSCRATWKASSVPSRN